MTSCICEKCVHFIQHYSFETGCPVKVYCGFCKITSRTRKLISNFTECKHFSASDKTLKSKIINKKLVNEINDIRNQLNSLKDFIEKNA